MKSRLALTLMIVAGLMLSTTGAGLAISGNSGSGNAATNQYQQVEPKENENGNGNVLGQNQGGGDTQPTEQVAATGGEQLASVHRLLHDSAHSRRSRSAGSRRHSALEGARVVERLARALELGA